MAEDAAAPPGGVIHDLGYRRFAGERLGRWHAVRALYLHSLRAALGLGRGAKAKVLPFALFGVMCAPVLVASVIATQAGGTPIRYDAYPFLLRLPVIVFVAAQAPELLAHDLRNRVLPLYFSRPLHRGDYALAKLAAMATAVAALIGIPLLLLAAGYGFAEAKGLGDVARGARAVTPALAGVLVDAVLLAAIGLAVAAFSGKRAFATGGVVALFFVTETVSSIAGSGAGSLPRLSGLFSPFGLLQGFAQWVLRAHPAGRVVVGSAGPYYALGTAALLAVAVAVLLARYRKAAA